MSSGRALSLGNAGIPAVDDAPVLNDFLALVPRGPAKKVLMEDERKTRGRTWGQPSQGSVSAHGRLLVSLPKRANYSVITVVTPPSIKSLQLGLE